MHMHSIDSERYIAIGSPVGVFRGPGRLFSPHRTDLARPVNIIDIDSSRGVSAFLFCLGIRQ